MNELTDKAHEACGIIPVRLYVLQEVRSRWDF